MNEKFLLSLAEARQAQTRADLELARINSGAYKLAPEVVQTGGLLQRMNENDQLESVIRDMNSHLDLAHEHLEMAKRHLKEDT